MRNAALAAHVAERASATAVADVLELDFDAVGGVNQNLGNCYTAFGTDQTSAMASEKSSASSVTLSSLGVSSDKLSAMRVRPSTALSMRSDSSETTGGCSVGCSVAHAGGKGATSASDNCAKNRLRVVFTR